MKTETNQTSGFEHNYCFFWQKHSFKQAVRLYTPELHSFFHRRVWRFMMSLIFLRIKPKNLLKIMCTAVLMSVSVGAMAEKSLEDCINLAMDNGYADEHCASRFLEVCTTTSSKSELNRVYAIDKHMGLLGVKNCGPKGNPNGQRYTEAWQKIFKARDKM